MVADPPLERDDKEVGEVGGHRHLAARSPCERALGARDF